MPTKKSPAPKKKRTTTERPKSGPSARRGTRSSFFRAGDRSEYLALTALSRIAFVTPVPRQEDFGVVDLKCVLFDEEGDSLVAKETFDVQVKSSSNEVVWDAERCAWASSHLGNPLFLGVVSKDKNTLELYSCMNIWAAFFLRGRPRRMTLLPGVFNPNPKENEMPFSHRKGPSSDPVAHVEGTFRVFLGPAVACLDLSRIESEAEDFRNQIRTWVKLDRMNVAMVRFGRAAALYRLPSTSAEPRLGWYILHRNINQHGLLNKILPLMESLARSYAIAGYPDRATELRTLASVMAADAELLGGLGLLAD